MALNPQQQSIIINEIKKSLGKKDTDNISRYQMAKGSMRLRRNIWNNVRSWLFMLVGIASASFGLEAFLLPSDLIDGGVTGISLLTNNETGFPLSILIILFNVPFILLGWKQIGKGFSIKSIICISILAVVLATVHYPIVTKDKVLTAVFGGFFLFLAGMPYMNKWAVGIFYSLCSKAFAYHSFAFLPFDIFRYRTYNT